MTAAPTLLMGVVNVTPDSFSDGGQWFDPEAAVAHGLELLADGADILDVGGESTRPGATRPLVSEEVGRVLPVIAALVEAGATVSVDTMRAEVAEQAVAAGASIINDVSGGLADPDILRVAAEAGVTYVAMHWRAHSDVMQSYADYTDPVAEVRAELAMRVEAALAAGIAADRIVLDPGLGFAKRAEHNWTLLRHLHDPAGLAGLGHGLLVGASRKSFLGAALADSADRPRPVNEREFGHAALVALLADSELWGLRVHDVRATRDAQRVAAMMRSESP